METSHRSGRRIARTLEDPIAACARAIADVAGAEVDETKLSARSSDDEVSVADRAPVRGLADTHALYRAHHEPDLHAARAPREAIPRALFDALERERVEALGANVWAGVAVNLGALRALQPADASRDQRGDWSDGQRSGQGGGSIGVPGGADPLARTLSTVIHHVRDALAPVPVVMRPAASSTASSTASGPPGSTASVSASNGTSSARGSRHPSTGGGAVLGDIETRVASIVAEHLGGLIESLEDQALFAGRALTLIQRLGLGTKPGGGDGDMLDQAGEGEGEPEASASDDSDDGADDGAVDDDEGLADDESGEPDMDRASEDVDETTFEAASDAEEDAEAATGEARDEPPVAGVDPRATAALRDTGYRIYSRAFDEVVDARTLADAEVLTARRADLDRHLERQGRLVRRLATRLQKVLLARQRREWQHDLDEGELDTRRLHRLVTDPLNPLVFKGEVESAFRDTTVTLLIDNSRSMIGRPIMIAAACADLLARTLERCGVAVEVLGFTTVELHGGRSSEAWEAAGKPVSPGRLNDVRHIVYKSADVPYRSARRSLALMLERDILKQNIDGEALEWAASRLMRRTSERRILLVISDGAPVDTATLTANSSDYLDRHLDAVIADIERRGVIELAAIGIGHDVERFYSQAMSVFDARGLAPALLTRLESLFRRGRP